MPEGDTIHRAARRMNAALAGKRAGARRRAQPALAAAQPRRRASGSDARRGAEAFGKHLVAHFSDRRCPAQPPRDERPLVHRRRRPAPVRAAVAAAGGGPRGRLAERAARSCASSASRGCETTRPCAGSAPTRCAPASSAPRPIERLRRFGAGREIGDALLDQRIIAGIGNAIRNEALLRGPGQPVADGEGARRRRARARRRRERAHDADIDRQGPAAAGDLPSERTGGCPRCGARIESRGQGDDNRTAYWCPACQT